MSDIAHFDISQNENYSKWFEDAKKMIFYDIPNLDLAEAEFQIRLERHKHHLETLRENLRDKKVEYDALIAALSGRVAARLEARHKGPKA